MAVLLNVMRFLHRASEAGVCSATVPSGLRQDKENRLTWGLTRWRLVGGVIGAFGVFFTWAGINLFETAPAGETWRPLLMVGGFGGILSYVGSSLAVNRWRLSIDSDEVVVKYRPLPLRRTRRIPRTSIHNSVHERNRMNQRGTAPLTSLIEGGPGCPAGQGLIDPAVAAYLVWHVENELGCVHRPVAGEYLAAPHILARADGSPEAGSLQIAHSDDGQVAGAISLMVQNEDP